MNHGSNGSSDDRSSKLLLFAHVTGEDLMVWDKQFSPESLVAQGVISREEALQYEKEGVSLPDVDLAALPPERIMARALPEGGEGEDRQERISFEALEVPKRAKAVALPEPQLNDNALRVLRRRYLIRDEQGRIKETPVQMFDRVASFVAEADSLYGDFDPEETRKRFYRIMASLEFMPNSPTLMNAGHRDGQLSACFVLPVDDSIESIFEAIKYTAVIHQTGGGTGFSFSRLRPAGDVVRSTSGVSSGPVTFMRVFDVATETIKQGGRRRGANMGILSVDHPDIMDFITSKADQSHFRNFNISVALTEAFMRAVEQDSEYDLINPRQGKAVKRINARMVFDTIVKMAWKNGEPGIIFIDRINRDQPTPHVGTIESTNPCVVASTRIATSRGLVRIDELARTGEIVGAVVREERMVVGGKAIVGAVVYPMSRVFKTREDVPVVTVQTKHGYEITCTNDHRFITSRGKVKAIDLQPQDILYLQPGEGCFGDDDLPEAAHLERLIEEAPPMAAGRLKAKVARGDAHLPNVWTEELGEVLGWAIGDGYISGNRIYLYVSDDEAELLPVLRDRFEQWFGSRGSVARRNHVTQLSFPGLPARFFRALGLVEGRATTKRVPEAIFTAPRHTVVAFLRGLFTTDGTVNTSMQNRTCSVRLASSSRSLLLDVQQLLLNLGLMGRIHLRRKATEKAMPGSDRTLKLCPTSAQYELILDGVDRDIFAAEIGFLTPRKQQRVEQFIRTMPMGSRSRAFETHVLRIVDAGKADVFNVTQMATNIVTYGGIVTSNCGEQPLLPYESCNLGSINLAKMVSGAKVDWDKLKETVWLAVHFLDNVIDMNHYPLPEIERTTKGNRKIGLGVMGFADALIRLGIPYNSDQAETLGRSLMAFIDRESKKASMALAERRGEFPNYQGSIYDRPGGPKLRNATTTTIAPTGSISIISGCSSGVEPLFAVAFERNVLDNEKLTEVNPLFEEMAQETGIFSEDLIREVVSKGRLADVDRVPEEMRRLFVTSHEVTPEWHVRLQAAFQEHTDNAVSKTVNFSEEATEDDIRQVYLLAYKLGCKGVTVYRDGSREGQVLAVQGETAPKKEEVHLKLRDRPDFIYGSTQKMVTGCGNLYVTINEDEQGPFELFTSIGKAGGCAASQAEATGRLISLALRCGIDPHLVVAQLLGVRCPSPVWKDGEMILSCTDAIARAMKRYLDLREQGRSPSQLAQAQRPPEAPALPAKLHRAPSSHMCCPDCGSEMAFDGGCMVCPACAYSRCY